jgi:hypothetical protein
VTKGEREGFNLCDKLCHTMKELKRGSVRKEGTTGGREGVREGRSTRKGEREGGEVRRYKSWWL